MTKVNVAAAIPQIFRVTVTDLPKLLRSLEGKTCSFPVSFRGEEGTFSSQVTFAVKNLQAELDDPELRLSSHSPQITAIETLAATMITSRIGAIIRDSVVAARNLAFAGDIQSAENNKIKFDQQGQIAGFDTGYLEAAIDLSKDFTDEDSSYSFEVLDVTLHSPLTLRSRFISVLVAVEMAVAPVKPMDMNLLLNTLNTVIAITGLVIQMERSPPNRLLQSQKPLPSDALIADTYQQLFTLSQKGDVKLLQFYLAELGYYDGTIDGKLGTETAKAVKRFAKFQKFDPDTPYMDPGFLQALAKTYVSHNIENGGTLRR